MKKNNGTKNTHSFYAYNALRRKVMKTSNPEEKDWIRLKYEDKMDWINKYGKILEF